MLSLENLRYYCRTCLMQLETSSNIEETNKFVIVAQFPEVEQLMYLCLRRETNAGNDVTLMVHTPNICRPCADKWNNLLEHYQLAIRSDKKLRKLLERELNGCAEEQTEIGDKVSWSIPEGPAKAIVNVKVNCAMEFTQDKQNCLIVQRSGPQNNPNKFNEVFIETQPLSISCEIEMYETISPFYQDNNINASISDQPLTEEHNCLLEQAPIHEENDVAFSSNDSSIALEDQAVATESLNNRNISKKGKFKQRKNTTKSSIKNSNKKLKYHCEPCKKYFYEINKYEGHVKQVHKGIQKAYQCNNCSKAYNSYKNLGYHIAENHARKSQVVQKCEECNKIFKTSVTLRQHMYHKHVIAKQNLNKNQVSNTISSSAAGQNSRDQTRTICEQCGFMAAHQYSLAQHIKNKHTEAQDFKCQKCPKIFKSQYSLKYHMLSNHTNIKPYQCSECQMTFTRQGLLNIHKRTHIKYNERIKCDFEGCDVRFVKHGDKRHHVRLVHLKVKQHICEFCGEAFGAMQTLRHHRFIHTGEKPYNCNVCGQGFRQRTAMKTHSKTHFGKESMVISMETAIDTADVNENVGNNLN